MIKNILELTVYDLIEVLVEVYKVIAVVGFSAILVGEVVKAVLAK
jgi:xanthosine utilization system XapX-like protein